jgi:hypothetical protein
MAKKTFSNGFAKEKLSFHFFPNGKRFLHEEKNTKKKVRMSHHLN